MKGTLVAKAKAAIIKIGGFINRNYELLLIGGLIAAILWRDGALTFIMVLVIFYAKLSEIAVRLAVPQLSVTVNPTVVTNFGANVKKTAEEHF